MVKMKDMIGVFGDFHQQPAFTLIFLFRWTPALRANLRGELSDYFFTPLLSFYDSWVKACYVSAVPGCDAAVHLVAVTFAEKGCSTTTRFVYDVFSYVYYCCADTEERFSVLTSLPFSSGF